MAESSSTHTFPSANAFGSMSDYQLRQTISQLSTAAGNVGYGSVAPQTRNTYFHAWTPTPKTPAHASSRPSRSRTTRASAAAVPAYTTPVRPSPAPVAPVAPALPTLPPNPPRAHLPTTPQAHTSTYSSRLRTGATLLVQPILSAPSTAASARTATRRGGVINYADPGSGDDLPDAGALDSDDSDFIASGGTRTAIRQSRSRMTTGMNVFSSSGASPAPMQTEKDRGESDQSYLGIVPPNRFVKSRYYNAIPGKYISEDALEIQAQKRSALVPIRVEFETKSHRIRDCFVWNINETLIDPATFARAFCNDLDLPQQPWADTIANQIRAQLEDHEGVASMDLGQDGAPDEDYAPENGEELPECRVILSIDVQIANYHLMDHIEWDLLSPLTPEIFAKKLCMELGLSGEAVPLVAHALHEEIIKHKKDAIEWGVIGGEREQVDEGAADGDKPRDRSGFGLVKDKTGLGLGWGRAPKDGRGPKILRSVWRDWVEAEELKTRFEELTTEDIERREIERERASRRLRRETSKFQSSTRQRRR